jgi:hypothetical protein
MTERTSLLQEVGQAFRDNGLTAAITALVGGCLAVAATVSPADQLRAADEIEALPDRAMVVRMLGDYVVLRDQARACL